MRIAPGVRLFLVLLPAFAVAGCRETYSLWGPPIKIHQKDAAGSPGADSREPAGPHYDDTPPAVPRDYPWPPKPVR